MTNQQRNQWLVVDQLREPDVLRVLYERVEQPIVERLYDMTDYASLSEQSPLVIDVTAGNASALVADFWKGMWRNSGIVIETTQEADALLAHLRTLVTVQPPGRLPSLFRFYSPRVLAGLVSALESMDVERLLGPCSRWQWYWDGHEYELTTDGSTARSAMEEGGGFVMKDAHMQALRNAYNREGQTA